MSKNSLALMFALLMTRIAGAVEDVGSRPIQLHLSTLIVSVGKEQHRISNGATLPILQGERLRIEGAQLVGAGVKPDRIDLVGFASPNNAKDDRGVWIDTATQILPKFAVSPGGDKYAIRVFRRGLEVGQAFIQVVKPSLNYAEISVNGSVRLLRSDDILKVDAKDQFKLQKVVTNFGETSDVNIRLEPMELKNPKSPYQLYEMQLVRKNIVFARLTLQVRDE